MYQAGSGTTAKVLARGLGVLPIDKQVEELKGWLEQMAAQIPGADGLTADQRDEQLKAKDGAVIMV
jgi:transcription-repair coupling factor (superfamily II helicase)